MPISGAQLLDCDSCDEQTGNNRTCLVSPDFPSHLFASGQKQQDARKCDKYDGYEEHPSGSRHKSMSAICANPYVQTNSFLAGWASLHCGQSMLRDSWCQRQMAAATNGDSWANSQFVGKPERSVPVRTPSRKWSFIPKTQLASLHLRESRVRKTCTHGLGGGRWPASGQPDAPPPTRQKWCPHFGVAGHGVRRPFASSFKESYNAITSLNNSRF